MDVLNLDEAISRINDAVIPSAQAAAQAVADEAVAKVDAVLGKNLGEVKALIASLDGWTIEGNLGGMPFKFTLRKPK